MKADTWLYHRTEAPRLFMASEVPARVAEGWAETPAAFYEIEAPKPAPTRRGKGKA